MFNGRNVYKSVAAVIVQSPWVVSPELGEERERFLEPGDKGCCATCEGAGPSEDAAWVPAGETWE